MAGLSRYKQFVLDREFGDGPISYKKAETIHPKEVTEIRHLCSDVFQNIAHDVFVEPMKNEDTWAVRYPKKSEYVSVLLDQLHMYLLDGGLGSYEVSDEAKYVYAKMTPYARKLMVGSSFLGR
jgi:hypothetical protein